MLRSLFGVKKKRARGIVILMYHRIATTDIDPWDLAVSPQNFEEHLQILKGYNIVPLSELKASSKDRLPSKDTIAITFDDGYRDNFVYAKPLLEAYNMPASFFITTESIEKQQEFWWDALERICLQTEILPQELSLNLSGKNSLKTERLGQTCIETLDRLALYFKLCELVRKMTSARQEIYIEYLKVWSGNTIDRESYLTMRRQDLLDLHSNPLFTIGAHTVTHPYLANFSYDYQEREICDSIKYLETFTNETMEYFAYPHGGYNEWTLEILSKLGLKLAFTTNPGHFNNNSHPYTVPRLQVKNWDGITFASQLKEWTNFEFN